MIKFLIFFYLYLFLFLLYILNDFNSFNNYHLGNIFAINGDFLNNYIKEIPLFLIIFTSNIFEETMNFYLSSLVKFNITNLLFISLDYYGYYISHKILPNVYASDINQNITEHIDYNTPLYWRVVYSKTDYAKLLLENGFNIILCDSDLIFFKDPREYIFKFDTDLITSCDHKCPTMNSGF